MPRVQAHIYIYSPSGAVRDKAAFRRGVARLTALGYCVEVDSAALDRHQRFAGDDATRLAAIHRAAASGADLALISRGGYGLTRILPGIDYAAVAQAIDKGTRFIGISDFTAFQSAVLAQTSQPTWAGPALCEGFGMAHHHGDDNADNADSAALTEACLQDLMRGQNAGVAWRLPRRASRSPGAITPSAMPPPNEVHISQAVLWGGNLTVLTSLLGTPYFPSVKGGILFLEDVAEHPYRIERMLTQLLYAGVLARQQAILMGQFTEFKLTPHDQGFGLHSVVDWLRQRVAVPVLTDLPYGHVAAKVLLPVGARVNLTVTKRQASLRWWPA